MPFIRPMATRSFQQQAAVGLILQRQELAGRLEARLASCAAPECANAADLQLEPSLSMAAT